MEVLAEAAERVRKGTPICVVTVIQVSGSTPRHAGAMMAVTAEGETIGTIGGGAVEAKVTEQATEIARGGEPARVRHHLVRDLAMCCGGTMEFLLEPLAPNLEVVEQALIRWRNRQAGVLVTSLIDYQKTLVDKHDNPSDEEFAIPLLPNPRAVLFGAGHVARALGPLLAGLSFDVVVCDDGETGALGEVPTWANRAVDSFRVRDVERELGGLGAFDFVLILTRDHAIDQDILESLLTREDLAYLGLIASQGKVGRFRKRLQAKEIGSESDWQRLRAPVGLDIGAETPEEIAVAISAELIARRSEIWRQ